VTYANIASQALILYSWFEHKQYPIKSSIYPSPGSYTPKPHQSTLSSSHPHKPLSPSATSPPRPPIDPAHTLSTPEPRTSYNRAQSQTPQDHKYDHIGHYPTPGPRRGWTRYTQPPWQPSWRVLAWGYRHFQGRAWILGVPGGICRWDGCYRSGLRGVRSWYRRLGWIGRWRRFRWSNAVFVHLLGWGFRGLRVLLSKHIKDRRM